MRSGKVHKIYTSEESGTEIVKIYMNETTSTRLRISGDNGKIFLLNLKDVSTIEILHNVWKPFFIKAY
jgi:hypothetical protein